MDRFAYIINGGLSTVIYIFFIALIITFIVKKGVMLWAKSDREETISRNFSVLKISFMYALVAAMFIDFGANPSALLRHIIPVIFVGDLFFVNAN